MSKGTLYDKVWKNHEVGKLPTGQTQLFVGRHLMHEVTSPQAFEMLKERGLKIEHPELTFAVMDHIIPTDNQSRPFKDKQAELMAKTLEDNVAANPGITYFGLGKGQGVCHVVFAEKGVVWPGQIVVCGDSHTSTYGAFGALAFGIGTTQVSHVLATQTLAMDKLKVRRINFDNYLTNATAKDLALAMISKLGVEGGVGYAYEFGGEAVENMIMNERLTLCNMAVEGGARSGYVNPDATTIDYIISSQFRPDTEEKFNRAVEYWKSIASDKNAEYDDVVNIDASKIGPMVTWGTNPAQSINIHDKIPDLPAYSGKERAEVEDALKYMGLEPGKEIMGTKVDVAFIGSCTNGRFTDLELAAQVLEGQKVSIPTIVVPGSEFVKELCETAGYDKIFKEAGAEWRNPGCSMCLAMNPDRLVGYQRSISTSNRNFKGRQGSPTGRTHLANPATAAASAIEGKIADPMKYL
jgi:3-isopropylmalate/(R)-2-methylmalate dehydratase large subunit